MKTIQLNESQFMSFIKDTVNRVIQEGIYDYPDGIDYITLDVENDGELMEQCDAIVNALIKKKKRGEYIDKDILANSSVMKKFQQDCFNAYKFDQPSLGSDSPSVFRNYWTERIIDRMNDRIANA